jgi:3'-5' exoribonuclease
MELTRSDHPFINTLEVGDIFDGYFVLRTLQLSTTRANKPFLIFDFTDRSGHIKGKMWDDAELAYRALEEGIIVKVRAVAEEYQGQAELKILRIRPADDDPGDMTRFLPSADHEPEEDWAIIRNAVAHVKHPGLLELLKSVLEDEEFVAVFERAPAGKRWHHGYLGGLLEHTASMVKIVWRLSDHYDFLDRDLLIAGAMFHDIGKLEELRFDTTIDYTPARLYPSPGKRISSITSMKLTAR